MSAKDIEKQEKKDRKEREKMDNDAKKRPGLIKSLKAKGSMTTVRVHF
jgi:hypothetical protein